MKKILSFVILMALILSPAAHQSFAEDALDFEYIYNSPDTLSSNQGAKYDNALTQEDMPLPSFLPDDFSFYDCTIVVNGLLCSNVFPTYSMKEIYLPVTTLSPYFNSLVIYNQKENLFTLALQGGRMLTHTPVTESYYDNEIEYGLAFPSFFDGEELYLSLTDVQSIFEGCITCDTGTKAMISFETTSYYDDFSAIRWEAQMPYFKPENFTRYLDYLSLNPHLDPDKAIAFVNVNLDIEAYVAVEEIQNPAATDVLCTKHFKLSNDYVPEGLVSSGGKKLRQDAAKAYEAMNDAMKNDIGVRTYIISAYRSAKTQKKTFENWVKQLGREQALRESAMPGFSEHQTGLAIDIFQKKSVGSNLVAAQFETTPQYEWLLAHAHEYGFILRYPEGCEEITGYVYEPWHFRFVGTEIATTMFEQNITTYEEYAGKYLR